MLVCVSNIIVSLSIFRSTIVFIVLKDKKCSLMRSWEYNDECETGVAKGQDTGKESCSSNALSLLKDLMDATCITIEEPVTRNDDQSRVCTKKRKHSSRFP